MSKKNIDESSVATMVNGFLGKEKKKLVRREAKKTSLRENAFWKAVLLEIGEDPDDYRQRIDITDPSSVQGERPTKAPKKTSGQVDPTSLLGFLQKKGLNFNLADPAQREKALELFRADKESSLKKGVVRVGEKDRNRLIDAHIMALPVGARDAIRRLQLADPVAYQAKRREIWDYVSQKKNLKTGRSGGSGGEGRESGKARGAGAVAMLDKSMVFLAKVMNAVVSRKASPEMEAFAQEVFGFNSETVPHELRQQGALQNQEVVEPFVMNAFEKIHEFLSTRLDGYSSEIQDQIEQYAIKNNIPLGKARDLGLAGVSAIQDIADIGRVGIPKLMQVLPPEAVVKLYDEFKKDPEGVQSAQKIASPPVSAVEYSGNVDEPSRVAKFGAEEPDSFFSVGTKHSDDVHPTDVFSKAPNDPTGVAGKKHTDTKASLAKKMIDPDRVEDQDRALAKSTKGMKGLAAGTARSEMEKTEPLKKIVQRFAQIYTNDPQYKKLYGRRVRPVQVELLLQDLIKRNKNTGKVTGLELSPELEAKLPPVMKDLAKDMVEKLSPQVIAKLPEFGEFLDSEMDKTGRDVPKTKLAVSDVRGQEEEAEKEAQAKAQREKEIGATSRPELSAAARETDAYHRALLAQSILNHLEKLRKEKEASAGTIPIDPKNVKKLEDVKEKLQYFKKEIEALPRDFEKDEDLVALYNSLKSEYDAALEAHKEAQDNVNPDKVAADLAGSQERRKSKLAGSIDKSKVGPDIQQKTAEKAEKNKQAKADLKDYDPDSLKKLYKAMIAQNRHADAEEIKARLELSKTKLPAAKADAEKTEYHARKHKKMASPEDRAKMAKDIDDNQSDARKAARHLSLKDLDLDDKAAYIPSRVKHRVPKATDYHDRERPTIGHAMMAQGKHPNNPDAPAFTRDPESGKRKFDPHAHADQKALSKELIQSAKKKMAKLGMAIDEKSLLQFIVGSIEKGRVPDKYAPVFDKFKAHLEQGAIGESKKSMFVSIMEMLIDIGKDENKHAKTQTNNWEKASPAKKQKFVPKFTLKELLGGSKK